MKFKINYVSGSAELLELCDSLAVLITGKGHEKVNGDQDSNFILNLIDLDSPKPFRRRNEEEKVVSIAYAPKAPENLKSGCYTALVRSISNLLFCVYHERNGNNLRACSITPEVGFVEFDYNGETLYKYMYPVISSHFVLGNELANDSHLENIGNIREVEDLKVYGNELLKLGVLPSPFPLKEFLDQELIDHLYRLYQIKGLSYGNLSIRNTNHGTRNPSFWMTARGVNKSELRGVGQDILLVTGYNRESNKMVVSVPSEHDPRIRVSVDAIEHYLIYGEFPQTGAIVHVHAWIEDVLCTSQSYPCGTRELAENVVALLRKTPDPSRAEVGLKNHGLTITGPDISDIFRRIGGRLRTNVPMME